MRPFTLRTGEPALVQPVWFWNLVCVVAGLFFIVRGPLWPIARLMYLRGNDDILRNDGINNPPFERWVASFALFCLVVTTAAASVAFWYPLPDAWIAAAMFGVVYGYVTYMTFEIRILDGLKEIGYWVVIIPLVFLFSIVLRATPDKYHQEIE